MTLEGGDGLRLADTPFEFFTVAHLTYISNLSAGTLVELLTDWNNRATRPIGQRTRLYRLRSDCSS